MEVKLDRQELLDEYRHTELICFRRSSEYLSANCFPRPRRLDIFMPISSDRGVGIERPRTALTVVSACGMRRGRSETSIKEELSLLSNVDAPWPERKDEPSSNSNEEVTG
jgi:hypothetical protein